MSSFSSDAVGDVLDEKWERELVSDSVFETYKILIDWSLFSTIGFYGQQF